MTRNSNVTRFGANIIGEMTPKPIFMCFDVKVTSVMSSNSIIILFRAN